MAFQAYTYGISKTRPEEAEGAKEINVSTQHINPYSIRDEAYQYALRVPHSSPLAEVAKSLCIINGVHPDASANSVGYSMTNWQLKIVETILADALGEVLRNARS